MSIICNDAPTQDITDPSIDTLSISARAEIDRLKIFGHKIRRITSYQQSSPRSSKRLVEETYFDQLGRPVEKAEIAVWSNRQYAIKTWEYNENGRLQVFSNRHFPGRAFAGIWTCAYDSLGQLIECSSEMKFGKGVYRNEIPRQWTYRDDGKRASEIWHDTIHFLYDERGRLRETNRNGHSASLWEYGPSQLLERAHIQGSGDYEYTWDSAGNLVELVISSGAGYRKNHFYTRDPSGRVVEMIVSETRGNKKPQKSRIAYEYGPTGLNTKTIVLGHRNRIVSIYTEEYEFYPE